MTTSDWIQLTVSISTFLTVIVALFGLRLWQWKDRPRLEVSFEPESDRCLRKAVVPGDFINGYGSSDGPLSLLRTYFRLKVTNVGGAATGLKAKVELHNEDMTLADAFDPNYLNWIANKGEVRTDLAKGEDTFLDLVSIAHHIPHPDRVRIHLADTTSPRGIFWDRDFRPWILRLNIHGDNLWDSPSQLWKIDPEHASLTLLSSKRPLPHLVYAKILVRLAAEALWIASIAVLSYLLIN